MPALAREIAQSSVSYTPDDEVQFIGLVSSLFGPGNPNEVFTEIGNVRGKRVREQHPVQTAPDKGGH